MIDNSLTAIGAFPSVGHTHQPFLVDLSPSYILVLKVPSVDACPTSTISSGDVPALDHELVNDPMKRRQFVRQRIGGTGLSKRSSTYCSEAGTFDNYVSLASSLCADMRRRF